LPLLSVKRFRVEGIGKPVVELVDENDCIADSLASLYLTNKEHLSHNTIIRQAYELRFFLLWCKKGKINIYDRIKCFEFLSELEVRAFIYTARHNANAPQFLLSLSKEPTDKYFNNALNQVVKRGITVSLSSANGRLRRAADYLGFCHQELNRHKLQATKRSALDRVISLLLGALTKELSCREVSDPTLLYGGRDFESVLKALSTLNTDSENHPFSPLTRVRNRLIVELMIDTGIRRASIARLKISDIFFEGQTPKIWIRRQTEDQSDPRSNKPEQKTREHFCYPVPETMDLLKKYIEEHRPHLINERSGEFVFLVEKNSRGTYGAPISLSSISYIFSRLSEHLNVDLYPHKLRHIWNMKFSELNNSGEYSSYEIDKARRLLMGWSPTSEMPSLYNRTVEVERAQELVRQLQQGRL